MSGVDQLKAEIKQLSAKDMNLKIHLHDLSEELPVNWGTILTVAQETYDAYAALEAARAKLKELESA
jgi:hypothetical protein